MRVFINLFPVQTRPHPVFHTSRTKKRSVCVCVCERERERERELESRSVSALPQRDELIQRERARIVHVLQDSG